MRYFDYSDILTSLRWLFDKDVVKRFERQFSQYQGTEYVIATSYGRTALHLSLLAIDAKGNEVIIPSFICTVVRQAVTLSGAIPRFVDISHETLAYDLNHLKNSITTRTKAILVTHYFGQVSSNLEEILTIAKEYGILIIEDCAHSMGATYKGKKVGTFGDLSIFSLTKSSINYGGGFLTTNNESLYLKAINIVENEKFNFIERLSALPFILTYGLKQLIEKIYFDRVGYSIFKWWLIKAPNYILYALNSLISILMIPIYTIFQSKKNPALNNYKKTKPGSISYSSPLAMNPLIAATGINQLKKMNYLINKRKIVHEFISKKIKDTFRVPSNRANENSCSFIVFKFSKMNIFDIISKCRQNGLLLKATWPTHQKLWKEQDTENVNIIAGQFLTWTVNPMITKIELSRFIQIINSLSNNNSYH